MKKWIAFLLALCAVFGPSLGQLRLRPRPIPGARLIPEDAETSSSEEDDFPPPAAPKERVRVRVRLHPALANSAIGRPGPPRAFSPPAADEGQSAPIPSAVPALLKPQPRPVFTPGAAPVVRKIRPQPPFLGDVDGPATVRANAPPPPPPPPSRRTKPQPQRDNDVPAPSRAPQPSSNRRQKQHQAKVLRMYRYENDDGGITWGYENDDGGYKEETIGADCIVRGKFGYYDDAGDKKAFEYTHGNGCEPGSQNDEEDDEGAAYVDYDQKQVVYRNGEKRPLPAPTSRRTHFG